MLSILALLGAFLLMPFVAQAQQMCSITVEQPQGGTIKVYPGTKISGQTVAEVEAGSQVTMRLSPTKGYKIDYWLVNGNRVEIDPGTAFVNNKKTITISEPTTISAVLKESGYLVSYEQPEGGTLMVKTIYPETDVPSGTRVEEGKSLKITATVNEGNQFKHFLVNDEVKVPSNLTQPRIDVTANSDLTIAAVIETAQPCIVTIKPFDHGYLKVTYGDYSNPTEVQNGNEVPLGEMLRVDAYFDEGYELDHFLVDNVETPSESQDYAGIKVIARKAITLSAVAKAKAAPQPTKYTVTLGDLPAEQGTFTATYGADNTAVQNGAELPEGTKITFTATAAEGYEFDHWMVNDVKSDDTSNPLVITLAAALKVAPVMKQKATPQPTTYTVTLGNIPEEQGYYYAYYDGGSIANGGSKAVPAGTEVTFQIDIPNGDDFLPKYNVTSWSVNGKTVEEQSATLKYTPTEDVEVFPVLKKNGTEPDPGPEPTPKGKVTMIPPKNEQGEQCGTLTATYTDDDYNDIDVNDGDEVPVNTTVSFVVTLDEGYEVDSWKVNGDTQPIEPFADPNEKAVTVEDADGITVEPIVKKKGAAAVEYTITMVQPEEGQGTLTAHVGNKTYKGSEFKATAGTEIFFSVEPAADYEMYYWLINDQRVDPSAGNPNQLTRKVEGNLKVEPILMSKSAPEPTKFSVRLGELPAEQGTFTATYGADKTSVQSGDELPDGTEITFTATPAEGYEFDYWMVNDAKSDDTNNPLVITLSAAVKVAPVMKAKPAPQPTEAKITMVQPDATQGLLIAYTYGSDGMPSTIVDGMTVKSGTEVTFAVSLKEGYEMDYWLVNDQRQEVEAGKFPHKKTIKVTSDIKVQPVLKAKTAPQPKKFEVSYSCGDHATIAGTVNGVPFESGDKLAVGTEVVLTVTPEEGYEVKHWIDSDDEVVPGSEGKNSYTFTVDGYTSIVAKIQKKKDTPQHETVHVKVEYESINGSITTTYVAPDGSSQSITGEDDIPVGSVVTLRAMIFMPDYQVVYMNNGEVVSKDALSEDGLVYTFTANEDASIQALFSKKTTPEPTNKAKITFKEEGTGGFVMGKYKDPESEFSRSIFNGDTKDLPIGTVITFTATLLSDAYQVTYTNNGEAVPAGSLSKEGTVYTLTVKGDATVLATFSKKEVPSEDYTFTFEGGKGGTVTATVLMDPIESGTKIAAGTMIRVEATPDENYEIDEWRVNDELVSTNGKEYYYVTLMKDTNVKVTFKSTKPVEYAVTVAPVLPSAEAGTVKLYKENGTAVESGTAVAVNTKMYVEVKPAAKYELETLQVNNTTIKAGDAALVNLTDGGFKYSFTVTEATTIKATFKLGGAVEQLTQNQIAAYVTNGGTRLEVTGATEGTEVRLYDYTGQLLLSSTEHALDISALPAGGYIVLVGNYTTRIVK